MLQYWQQKGRITAATYRIRLSISTTHMLDTPNTFQQAGKCPQNCKFPGEDPDPPPSNNGSLGSSVSVLHLDEFRRCSKAHDCDRQTQTGCLQIEPNQFPGDIKDTFLKHPRRFLRGKPYNIKMQAKFVLSEDLLFLSFSWHLPSRDANPWDHSDPVHRRTSLCTAY